MAEDKRRILVVEDMDGIRDLISATLRLRGFSIEKVTNGSEAIKTLLDKPEYFDLIISDYDMPEMNGQQLLEEVKTHDILKSKPFIMLTSRNDPDKIKTAKERGLSAWIVKPFKVDSFVATIDYAIKNG